MLQMFNIEYHNERDKESMGLYGVNQIINDDSLNKTVNPKMNQSSGFNKSITNKQGINSQGYRKIFNNKEIRIHTTHSVDKPNNLIE